jgi:hypothetical protein
MKLIYVKAEIGFGFDFKVENWFASDPMIDVEVKVAGSLTLDVPFNIKFSSDNTAHLEEKISATTKPALVAKAKASALGYTAGASIELTCGIAISGTMNCSFKNDPSFTGKIEWLPIVITARVEYPYARPWTKEVFKWPKGVIQPIWQDSIPKLSA